MSLNAPWTLAELSYGCANSVASGAANGWRADVPMRPRRSLLSVRAGLAELVLLNRLRARMQCDAGLQTQDRAAQIIEVTSRHWFGEGASEEGSAAEPLP